MTRSERRRRNWLGAGLIATVALLLAHSALYWFLTDDAFISFRYARNLVAGHGLVFNPGLDRVEGYTNFLWVLILAGFASVGLRSEIVANVLSLGATAGVWVLVTRRAIRGAAGTGAVWVALLPGLFLAVTRSVAVWSTGGLETRLFEFLVLAGALRVVDEIEEARNDRHGPVPVSGVLFGLASLTRPDGLLLSACALGCATLLLAFRGRFDPRAAAWRLGGFAVLAGSQFVFRLAYYGTWLPNTYYAKVGGRTWWDMGAAYLGLFALEYGVVLWVPLLVAGIAHHRRHGTAHVPLVFGAMLLPYVVYVASIGGDHFEFRPLDLIFPFTFVLMADGATHLSARRGPWLPAALAGIVVAGLVWIPWQSHRQFPSRYHGGFPGNSDERTLADAYLAPERDPILRLPGLRWYAEAHRRLLGFATSRFVALRQEEHRLFLERSSGQGRLVRAYIDGGLIPADLHVSLACVGAVPYYTNLPTLDRLGLTDAFVARAEVISRERFLAHEKRDVYDYARRIGVEFWPFRAVELVLRVSDPDLLPSLALFERMGTPLHWADLGDGNLLVGQFPQGAERTLPRFPRLRFRRSDDPDAFEEIRGRVVRVLEAQLRDDPEDWRSRLGLAQAYFMGRDAARAEALFAEVTRREPESIDAWKGWAGALAATGRPAEAAEAMERAIRLAREAGRDREATELERVLRRISP